MNSDKPMFVVVLYVIIVTVGWFQVVMNDSIHGQIQGLATMILGSSVWIINDGKGK